VHTEVRKCLLLFSAEHFTFQFVIKNVKIKINKIIILPAVLYGCENCFLTCRWERSLKSAEENILT
jgi:hypothetical protein